VCAGVATIRRHRHGDDPAVREQLLDPHWEAAPAAHAVAVSAHQSRVRCAAVLALIVDYVHHSGPLLTLQGYPVWALGNPGGGALPNGS
jgi:hypothetical protein